MIDRRHGQVHDIRPGARVGQLGKTAHAQAGSSPFYSPIMASDRIQRRIERLLDQIEESMDQLDWESVREYAQAVLRLEPENKDAVAYLAAAEREPATEIATREFDVGCRLDTTGCQAEEIPLLA